ncbi:hypothetical protein H257_03978 [Aphanomyces astaci]|uniref:Uncharacterized protein n=1 Tax=Aphanomyces astaci TaxID=112090 RepID=W4GVY9_APHAT|nr:hypothetical protein H257_03978 [Aphanomyces astaci]ETV83189.1 hypothetical protein H257_03978 [Aphanomyces astaci]|eukprot:XP_009826619.1 hypothetical protein H257_03978 [Aphanomyces astaci]
MSWLKGKMRAAANMVAQAAEAVAPSLALSLYKTPVEEFHHRWTTVSLFLDALAAEDLPDAQQRAKLSDSNTRDNLAKLVKLLYAEEDALDRQVYVVEEYSINARPCMEYLLEHNVLQNLCAKAALDSPCGLMVLVLIFLTDLLRESRINYPILPTRGVYRSVCELIQAAMVREVEDDMVQKCLLHCLHALWVKLKGDPVQTEFFFLRIYKPVPGDQPGNLVLSPSKISELVLFTGLLPHMYRDGKLGHKCREALVIAAGLHEPGLSRFILHMTPFCNYAVTGVIQAFDALPKAIGVKNEKTFRSVHPQAIVLELETLALRLRFCCTLAMVGTYQGVDTCITKDILTQFHTRFLQGPLLEALLDPSEAAARTGIHYTCIVLDLLVACGRSPDANPMLHLTLSFLLHHHQSKGGGFPSSVHTTPRRSACVPVVTASNELALAPPHSSSSTPVEDNTVRLLSELLHRTNSLSPSLSVAAIDLIALLLRLNAPQVDEVLLPPPVFAPSSSNAGHPTRSNHVAWFASRFPHSLLSTLDDSLWHTIIQAHTSPTLALPPSPWSSGSFAAIPFAASDWNGFVVSLMSYVVAAEQRVLREKSTALVANTLAELCSSDDTDEDSEGDEPPALLPPRCQTRRRWHVRVPSLSSTDVVDSIVCTTPSASSSWGPFEAMVVNRLERWLDNSLEENVALSGLVVLLAERVPHVVFAWSSSPSTDDKHSLRSVLEDVHGQAYARIRRLPDRAATAARLAAVKARLMTPQHDDKHDDDKNDDDHVLHQSFDGPDLLLVSFVVLEEMLMELVATLVAVETVRALPEKPEGVYLEANHPVTTRSYPDDDDNDDDDNVLTQSQSQTNEAKVDEMDFLLTSAASQLASIMMTRSAAVP